MDNREKQPMDLSYKEALQELEQAMKLIEERLPALKRWVKRGSMNYRPEEDSR